MRRIYEYLVGYTEFTFPESKRARILTYLLGEGIGCRALSPRDGLLRMSVLSRDAGRIPPSLGCTLSGEGGAPSQFRKLLLRPGIILGCMLGCLLLLISSLTVWRVEILGNDRIEASVIEAALKEAGLSVGDLTPRLDTAAVKTRFLRQNPDISWIGIYQRGTTAVVEVRETEVVDSPIPLPSSCLNLVAGEDAVIERVRVENGRAVVKEGETVRAGALLISGIYKTADGLKTSEARGEVLGRVTKELSLFLPAEHEEKEYISERTTALTITFFQKVIKLFDFTGKNSEGYDIIERKEPLVLFGRIRLPISFTRTVRRAFVSKKVVLGEEELVRRAYESVEAELSGLLATAQLLRKQMEGELTEEGYRLSCRLEYLTDIAVPLSYGKD